MSTRKKILAASFFPAFFPPSSGGEQRFYYLYYHLSRWFDITLISSTYGHHDYEVIHHSEALVEHRIPKDTITDSFHAQLAAKEIGPECSGLVVALAGSFDTVFQRKFASLTSDADIIVHESPFTVLYDKNGCVDGKPRVYNSYNLEANLAKQMFHGDFAPQSIALVKELEGLLVETAAHIFATCIEEKEAFAIDYGIDPNKISIVPNGFEGVEVPDSYSPPREALACDSNSIVFLGSAHPPNIQAVQFILETLAPNLPALEFKIVGAVCGAFETVNVKNVSFLGFMEEAKKNELLIGCGAAINPLFSGAGTNLKMLDYMASGAKIVTTPIGARGLKLENNSHAIIVEPDEFAMALEMLVLEQQVRWAHIGENAKKFASENYTWTKIAQGIRPVLETLQLDACASHIQSPGQSERGRIVVVNDFPVSEGIAGGEVRIREMLSELGFYFDVHLICLAEPKTSLQCKAANGFYEWQVAKTAEHALAEKRASNGEWISVNDLVASEYILTNNEFTMLLKQLSKSAVAIIFEHPYLAPLINVLDARIPIIYSSLNVEMQLKSRLLEGRKDCNHRVKQVVRLETKLLERSDLTICVSTADKSAFEEMDLGNNYFVVENGIRLVGVSPFSGIQSSVNDKSDKTPAIAIFVGSGHPPNIESLNFIISELAPKLDAMAFIIVGSVCNSVDVQNLPDNVFPLGVLEQREKDELMRRVSLALNPMFSGGGSSLKVPDYFAAGLPVVSSKIGVRGYDLVPGKDYLLAETDNFVDVIRGLVESPELGVLLAKNGYRFVSEHLDWQILGKRYAQAIESLSGSGTDKLKILFLTYRCVDPGPGGAEIYINNVLSKIAEANDVHIDAATGAIDTINNKWHFSADYTLASEHTKPDYLDNVYRFELDEIDEHRNYRYCQKLFSLWARESIEHANGLVSLLRGSVLLGGWNFYEKWGPETVRWATSSSQILLDGSSLSNIQLIGHSPQQMTMEMFLDGIHVDSVDVKDDFSFHLQVGSVHPVILTMNFSTQTYTDGDPREKTVVFTRILLEGEDQSLIPIDLEEDYSNQLRLADPEKWVESLIAQTEKRTRQEDALFIKVRGPHSVELLDWLERNIENYDVVLAQGVPFASSVIGVTMATKHGVPVVTLPHFHMEDRYYHWKSYFDCFRQASTNIAFPNTAKRMFFDKIGADCQTIPGGGVDLEEFEATHLLQGKKNFHNVHRSENPFVLVLGRKDGAKNYDMAIEAIEKLNKSHHAIDLVMIGPDNDGVVIDLPNVYYYGSQSRSVVLGALASSICLVNMSESESFGIVILESWLAGRPVIVQSKCLAFEELVDDGKNGRLVQSVNDLVEQIFDYHLHPELMKEHASNGGDKAQGYSWVSIARQVKQVLLQAALANGNRDQQPSTH